MPETNTDEMLLAQSARGDEAAFAELYERHRTALYGFAYRLLGARDLAEDIAHDCFLSLIRQPVRFDAARARAGSLRPYLYGAARNLAMKHFRRERGVAALEDTDDEPQMPERDAPLRRLLDEELASEVRRAVGELSPLQREALILFEYEELTLAEIAGIVGADTGTVKARVHRARARLRRTLAPYLNESVAAAAER